MKHILLTPAKCIGCGICSTDAPHIFMEHDNGNSKINLLDSLPHKNMQKRVLWPDELQLIQAIVKLCSVKAIKIV